MSRDTQGGEVFNYFIELMRQLNEMPDVAFEVATEFLDARLQQRCSDTDCSACVARPYYQPVSLHMIEIIKSFKAAIAENHAMLEEVNTRFEHENPRFRNKRTTNHRSGNPLAQLLSELMGAGEQVDARMVSPEELLGMLLGGNRGPRI